MKKRIIACLMVCCMAVSMAACGGGGSDSKDTGVSAASETSGGASLNIALDTTIVSMDSSLASDSVSISVIGNVQEGLYRMGSDNTVEPVLSAGYEVSDDGLTYTFTLRDDAKWSNGEPVTAADFVYGWQRLADPDTGSENEWMMELVGVKNCQAINTGEMEPEELGVSAPDDTTFVVTLDSPCPYFVAVTCFNSFYPLNQEYVEEKGENYALTADDILFNGAYVIDEWDVGGDSISIRKNENYYDADSVSIDKVNFRVISDKNEAVMAYENGEVDYCTITGTLAEPYEGTEDLVTVEDSAVTLLMPNFEKPGLDNVNFRMAIGYAINREELLDSVLKDGSLPLGGVVPAGLVSNSNGEDYRDYAGSLMGTDKDLAKEYWEKAKAETDVRSITLLYDESDTNAKVAAYIQSELESTLEGLTVELQSVPFKTKQDRLGDGDYDICLMKWGPDYADPVTILSLYDPRNNNPNYSRFDSEEFLEMYELSNSTEYLEDEEGRWNLLLEMEKEIIYEGASLPLYQRSYAVLRRSNIQNMHYNMCGTSYYYKDISIEE